MMRKSLIGVALALLVMLLNGCMSPDKKEITVMWWGDVYNARFAQKLVDAYNADHPAMPAKLITTSGNYASKLLTMAASGTLPDVILMVTRDVHNLGSRGALLSLNQYESTLGFPDKQAMWDDLLDDVKQKGKLLAFPIWTWTPGIYYNKDLFDKVDVAYPTDNWTWAEFAEKSIKLTKKKNGKTTQYAIDMAGNLDHSFFLSYIYGHGGKVYSDDLTKCEIASPQTLAALKLFFELKLKHGIAPTSAEQASLATGGTLADYFQAGKTAMRCAGRDYMDVLRQGKGVSFRWGVAPMPSGSKKFFFRRISSLAIAKQSKHPNEAWKFISFAISEEGQRLVTLERSDVTIRKALTNDKSFLGYQDRSEVNALFRDMLLDAIPEPYIIGSEEWKKGVLDQFELVELGRTSLDNACKNIEKTFGGIKK